MKTENFRVYLRDEKGNAVTFERFACKTLKSVIRNMHILLDNNLYRTAAGEIASAEYYTVIAGKIDKLVKCERV